LDRLECLAAALPPAICVSIVSSVSTAKTPIPADGADGVMLKGSILLVHILTAASTLSASAARDEHLAKQLSIERDFVVSRAHVSA